MSEVIDFIRLVKLKFPEDDTAWEISIKQSKKKLEIEHTVFEIDEMCRTVKCPESFFYEACRKNTYNDSRCISGD